MADDDDKKDSKPEQVLVNGKPVNELNLEEILDAMDRGEVELPQKLEPRIEDTFTMANLEKFIMGEITWAQLQGMTIDEAYNIAEYAYQLYQDGRYHDARVIFEGLVLSNPYDAYFHNMLGAIYQQLDLREESLEEYTTAIELDDENLHAHVNRGELLLQSGDFEHAVKDLRRAIELDPQGKDPASIRARALAAATANALEEIKKLVGNDD